MFQENFTVVNPVIFNRTRCCSAITRATMLAITKQKKHDKVTEDKLWCLLCVNQPLTETSPVYDERESAAVLPKSHEVSHFNMQLGEKMGHLKSPHSGWQHHLNSANQKTPTVLYPSHESHPLCAHYMKSPGSLNIMAIPIVVLAAHSSRIKPGKYIHHKERLFWLGAVMIKVWTCSAPCL